MGINIAIDGPAGAGKSTIAKIVAKKKGYIYVDTGAMYRAMAYFLLQRNIDPADIKKVAETSREADITIKYTDSQQHVFLNGEDVTAFLRREEVGNMASASSPVPELRKNLTLLQQKLAEENDVVMDGRDIGTVVLPGADLKVFMTASSSVRAKRRYDELTSKGQPADLKKIEADIIERDNRDMTRETAPLKQAEDAWLLDTSEMSVEEVADAIISKIDSL